VLSYLDVGQGKICQEARIDVGGDDPALRTDLLGQPPGYRPMSSTDFQAAPTLPDSKCCQMPMCG
jgi:hypothetical protein